MAPCISVLSIAVCWAVAAMAAPETSRFLGKATASGGGQNTTHIGEVSVEEKTREKNEMKEEGGIGEVSADPETEAKMAAKLSMLSRSAHNYSSCSCCHHEEKISNPWASCASKENRHCGSCSLYGAVRSHPRCGKGVAIVGEKVCPVAPIGGGEGITSNNAGAFSDVWTCAASKTGSSANMGLILNPWKARTQHHLHVKTMPLDNRGMLLRKSLEKITQCKTGTWHNAHFKCPYSKARLYSSMPPVFSEVVELAASGELGHPLVNPEGQATLARVGITVLFVCKGKPVVLAHGNGHGGCSIEHSIYGR